MELLQQLTQQLGVNEDQARGGAGMIFKLAQDKLGGDFKQVADVVPGMDSMLSAAPGAGGLSGGLGGALGALSGALGGGKLGALASLAGGFSKLGLDAGMVGKFLPVVLSFVKDKGGDGVMGLLQKVLK
jgi:hypothetical protein